VIFLCALVALLAASTAFAAKGPRDFFGVGPQTALTTQDIDRMGRGKVGTLRFQIFWAGRNTARGEYDWGPVDETVRDAARNNIRLLPFIFGTPDWVAKLDGRNCERSECWTYAPRGTEALAAWSSFLREAARRYGPDGTFWTQNPVLPKNPIRHWQIWNEQNSPSWYKPKPKVGGYADLLEAADRALGAVDPAADVIVGGLFYSPLQGTGSAMFSDDYLRRLYNIKGARKHFDAIAPHPYASRLRDVKFQVKVLRKEMRKAGDRKSSIWVTEVGWASGGPKHPLIKGRRGQADRLRGVYRLFLKKRRAWNIETVAWFSWRDDPNPSAGVCDWCPLSGLMTADLQPKPAWKEFVRFTGGS